MLNPTNQVALLAAHATGCSYLYPDPAGGSQLLRQQDGQYEEFYQVETVIRERVGVVMAKDKEGGQASSESLLSGALAMALAYINKQQAGRVTSEKLRPRLLAMSATGDSAAQYMNYMNVFFTAQKLNITLDTCMLLQDSGLLQQGSDITGGLYVKVEQLSGLLQYLTWLFLPGPSLERCWELLLLSGLITEQLVSATDSWWMLVLSALSVFQSSAGSTRSALLATVSSKLLANPHTRKRK